MALCPSPPPPSIPIHSHPDPIHTLCATKLQNYKHPEWVPHRHGYYYHTMEQTYQVQLGSCLTQHERHMSGYIYAQDNTGHQEALEDQLPEEKVTEEEESDLE